MTDERTTGSNQASHNAVPPPAQMVDHFMATLVKFHMWAFSKIARTVDGKQQARSSHER